MSFEHWEQDLVLEPCVLREIVGKFREARIELPPFGGR